MQGELAQGMGYAMFENAVLDGGGFAGGNLADYTVPNAGFASGDDLDLCRVARIPTVLSGPRGARSAPSSPAAPPWRTPSMTRWAVRLTALPIRPETVLKALSEAGSE